MEITDKQKEQLLKDLWYSRNPCHDKGQEGNDRFWGTVLCVFNDYQKALTTPVVTCRFSSVDEKLEQFKKELKALLVKFDAELIVEDFGRDWSHDEKIVVNFNWDEDLANRTENGIVPDWVVGKMAGN